MNCSRCYIIDQIKEEVLKLALCMKYKRLTDKQSESTSVTAPFRKIFKHKLHLASSIPNAILNNNFIYVFRNLYELQLQSKISNYNLQINSRGLLGIITDIRICKLQHLLWLPSFPLLNFPFDKPFSLVIYNFHFRMILLCKQFNFSFNINHLKYYTIIGGNIEIRSLIPLPLFIKSLKVLKNRSLMFLE
ncbi:hypothetical protein RhiirA1_480332 [Rhizophagus irregularis]|uniref:Uncharacterized protein n=1 Tax=Rhizophagus irregularis TaxID=588596 RepID=A0A2I1FL91_9GLOM|nr:hypothetical protein RhiirA1_480332 [Rhizophagus irregularis]PKY35121.1 hypothetical protein RhiirB3_455513 [Rhizophagus irregularis]